MSPHPLAFSDADDDRRRDPGPSLRPATVRRPFFRRGELVRVGAGVALGAAVGRLFLAEGLGPALALLGIAVVVVAVVEIWLGLGVWPRVADWLVPSDRVELDGLDGARVELDRARVRGELVVEPEEHYRHERHAIGRIGVLGGPAKSTPSTSELLYREFGPSVTAEGREEVARRIAQARSLGDNGRRLSPPRPPFVGGVFVGHHHEPVELSVEEAREVLGLGPDPEADPVADRGALLLRIAEEGFSPVVLGDGSCLRCGRRPVRVGWPVPAGLVFETFAPGRPLCSGCALRVALVSGDDVWLADELVIEPAPVSGRLRVRPVEVVVVPAVNVEDRILRELGA